MYSLKQLIIFSFFSSIVLFHITTPICGQGFQPVDPTRNEWQKRIVISDGQQISLCVKGEWRIHESGKPPLRWVSGAGYELVGDPDDIKDSELPWEARPLMLVYRVTREPNTYHGTPTILYNAANYSTEAEVTCSPDTFTSLLGETVTVEFKAAALEGSYNFNESNPENPLMVTTNVPVSLTLPPNVRSALLEQNNDGPARQGFILTEEGWKTVTYVESNGLAILDGDIVLGSVDSMSTLSRTIRSFGGVLTANDLGTVSSIVSKGPEHGRRWHGGVVPYTIDPSLPNKTRITEAIEHWNQAGTPIHLVRRTNQEDYIFFHRDPRDVDHGGVCESHIGRQGGMQDILLADECERGSIIHEIGHSVGLWHEQSRADRNIYVTYYPENVKPGKGPNFDQELEHGQDYGDYDYDSIMHYGKCDFSKDVLNCYLFNIAPTLVPKDPTKRIGQRNGLSAGDIAGVKFMYETLGSYWKQIKQDKGFEISIGADGSIYHIGQDRVGPNGNTVYKFDALRESWSPVPRVAAWKIAAAPDGTLWHINRELKLFKGETEMPGVRAIDIAVGADGSVYHVGQNLRVYKYDGSGWTPVGFSACRIAAAPDGALWYVNSEGDIYRNSQQIPGKAIDISVGADGSVYHVGLDNSGRGINNALCSTNPNNQDKVFDFQTTNEGGNTIYRWIERHHTWFPMEDAAAIKIAVDRKGLVWHLNKQKNIFMRL